MLETPLRYWREDPLLSEHHEHWHLVYPYPGRIDEKFHTKDELKRIALGEMQFRYRYWNERHGELFAYMHSQLLARYASERLSVGLAPVVPLDDYRAPIPEAYYPNIQLQLNGQSVQAANRPPNTVLSNLTNAKFFGRPGAQIGSQENFRERLRAAVASQSASNRPASLSGLAERIEPTARFATEYFGALHNDGHLLISLHDDDPEKPGCMFWEAAAVRDPVFYRWHAHIDDLFRLFQNALTPYDFSDLPPVEVTGLKLIGTSGRQNELETRMRTRKLRSRDPMSINYLSHEDFDYELSVTSTTKDDLPVTIRIFLAPQKHINERAAWIEMDKFRRTLTHNNNIVRRSSKNSSVVRHPVWTAEMLERPEMGPDESGASLGCRCGWPYTLLLPRGTPEGEEFRFIAFVTAGTDLNPRLVDQSNSSSYCGLLDSDYPDIRAMGYPFDRPFKSSVKDWVAGPDRPPQLGSALVIIKHYKIEYTADEQATGG